MKLIIKDLRENFKHFGERLVAHLRSVSNRPNKQLLYIGGGGLAAVGILYFTWKKFIRTSQSEKPSSPLIYSPVIVDKLEEILVVEETNAQEQNLNQPAQEQSLNADAQQDQEDSVDKNKAYELVNQDKQQTQNKSKLSHNEQLQKIIDTIKEPKFIGKSAFLELNTITAVLESSIELAEENYVNITIKNRAERRAVMEKDHLKYQEIIINYNEEVENSLLKAQEEILQKLNVQQEVFEDSVITLMERGLYQQVYMLQAAIRQKIKEKMVSKVQISISQIKEIMKYQIQLLKEKPVLIEKIIKQLQQNEDTAQLIPIVINNSLQDYIYLKFKVEEEDQMKCMIQPKIQQDNEIQNLLVQIEEGMFQIMGNFGQGEPFMNEKGEL